MLFLLILSGRTGASRREVFPGTFEACPGTIRGLPYLSRLHHAFWGRYLPDSFILYEFVLRLMLPRYFSTTWQLH
jgi:hypothetical protein